MQVLEAIRRLMKVRSISIDEQWTYIKSRRWGKIWIWLVVVWDLKIGIVSLGDRGEESLKRLLRLCPDAERYYTDRWRAYMSVLDPQKHILTKKKYININESVFSRLRHYLARMKRRTLSYSKSPLMLLGSLILILIKIGLLPTLPAVS